MLAFVEFVPENSLSVSRLWPRRTTRVRTIEANTEFVWAVVPHPPNSRYFTPLDLHIFGPSKDMDNLLNAIHQWLQRDDLFRPGMQGCWQGCRLCWKITVFNLVMYYEIVRCLACSLKWKLEILHCDSPSYFSSSDTSHSCQCRIET